jgi:ABC-type branched-subunit amino acid transport system ATPase component
VSGVLALRGIEAGYGKSAVLNGVSLDVGDGELVAVLGPNGSGKSTVAKTVMGMTTLYAGTIEWAGKDIRSAPTWRRTRLGLGYVPQVENVLRGLSVTDNLLIGAQDRPRREREERLAEILELFPELERRARTLAGNLSGGERRMLSLGAALVQHPHMLLLDEPTSDLAPSAIDRVFEKIATIREALGIPILMIEQTVAVALEMSDRVYILVRGDVVVDRACSDITQEEVGQVFLEHTAAHDVPPPGA